MSLAQGNKHTDPAEDRTQVSRSGIRRSNHQASAPPLGWLCQAGFHAEFRQLTHFFKVTFHCLLPVLTDYTRFTIPAHGLLFLCASKHYANIPGQYAAIFKRCKNDNFRCKKVTFFLFFAENIACWHTLEPHQRGDSNKCPQSLF